MWFLTSLIFGCAVPEYDSVPIYTVDPEENENQENQTSTEDAPLLNDDSTDDEIEVNNAPEMCNDGIISQFAAEKMLGLTEVTERETIYSIYDRIEGVAVLFENCSDPWGLFPTTYKYITARGIRGIEEGNFEDPAWAEDIIIDFAGRYLENLQLALLNEEPSWAWARYYDLADRTDVSKTRALLMAMSAHLLLDLPHSLAYINSTEEHKDDFFMFGDLMIEVSDDFVQDLNDIYGTDAEDILNGFFFGQWVDGAFGEDTSITLSYQAIRAKSWNNRWYIQQGWTWMADADISTSFWSIDAVLRGMDGAGIID